MLSTFPQAGRLALLMAAVLAHVGAASANDVGQALFEQQCAQCHGVRGAGTDEYPDALRGELAPLQLAEQIRLTMPEDNPESLTADEARAVANYIHESFYASRGLVENEPPRVELARLTVRQHRRAVADLVGSFREPIHWHGGEGLAGEYYKGRRIRGADKAVAQRVDPTIDFDFGAEAPAAELKEAQSYSMRWTGSLYASETGWHELIVRTEHAFRLWVNDQRTAVIDSWVKSGDDTEYRAKVFLLGGRAYPIKLEFSRGNQGVSDEKIHEQFEKSSPASLTLLWTPPHGAEEVIPARHLSPEESPETYVCSTAFPPDDRSYGWERGTAVSQAWFDATLQAAVETTSYVCDRLEQLADTRRDDPQYGEKFQTFCGQFAERAFRGPLDEQLRALYVASHFREAGDIDSAVRRSLLAILTSPRFLFREAGGAEADFDAASRLAFTLWDSLPDAELIEAARQGQLQTEAQIRQHAVRMLDDVRGRSKLRQFLLNWLQVDGDVDLHKDPQRFPEFDARTAADLRTSLELFLEEVVWSESSDYRRLFLADEVFLNERLARIYGGSPGGGIEFAKSRLDDGRRAGVLTHPYVLSKFAHPDETSPIHRGVFLVRGVIGQPLKPPPEAVAPLPAQLHPDLTTRERVTLQTKPASCMTCHHAINPLGFTLERFDAVGRYRETERDQEVDDTGEYQPAAGPAVTLKGARDLAEFLASSDEVTTAFTERLFRYFVQQPIQAYDRELTRRLTESFIANDYHIRKLVVDVAVAASRVGREETTLGVKRR